MSLIFTQPLWLTLCVFIPLLWWKSHRTEQRMTRFIQPHLWPWLLKSSQHMTKSVGSSKALALLLMIIALSQPAIIQQADSESISTDAVFVIDSSTSMSLTDVTPRRIDRATAISRQLLDRLPLTNSAVLVVAGHAYTLLPLNNDWTITSSVITHIDTEMTRVPGSNIAHGLASARELLQQSYAQQKLIILLSDGDTLQSTNAIAQAELLNRDHIRLYTIGIATINGLPALGPDKKLIRIDGQQVYSRLAEELLTNLAAITQGRYFNSNTTSMDDLSKIIESDIKTKDKINTLALSQLYQWPLALGLTLYLWSSLQGWRYGASICLLATVLISAPQTSQASIWTQTQAYNALMEEKLDKAISLYAQDTDYNSRIGLGSALYKKGQWHEALGAFKQAKILAQSDSDIARALFNSGNTLIRMGRLEQAQQVYRQVLTHQPLHKGASYNLGLLLQEQLKPGRKIKAEADTSHPEYRQQRQDENLTGLETSTTRQSPQTIKSEDSSLTLSTGDQALSGSLDNNSAINRMLRFRIDRQEQMYPNELPKQTW